LKALRHPARVPFYSHPSMAPYFRILSVRGKGYWISLSFSSLARRPFQVRPGIFSSQSFFLRRSFFKSYVGKTISPNLRSSWYGQHAFFHISQDSASQLATPVTPRTPPLFLSDTDVLKRFFSTLRDAPPRMAWVRRLRFGSVRPSLSFSPLFLPWKFSHFYLRRGPLRLPPVLTPLRSCQPPLAQSCPIGTW